MGDIRNPRLRVMIDLCGLCCWFGPPRSPFMAGIGLGRPERELLAHRDERCTRLGV